MNIPQSDILSTGRMSRIFDNTVATYKYYWFENILDLFVLKGKTRMDIWDIMVEMVVKAWYPACFFHLSFGKFDRVDVNKNGHPDDFTEEQLAQLKAGLHDLADRIHKAADSL